MYIHVYNEFVNRLIRMLNAWVNKNKYACLYVHRKEKICITDSNSYIKNIPPIVIVLRES